MNKNDRIARSYGLSMRPAAFFWVAMFLSGCGGGGSASSPAPTPQPGTVQFTSSAFSANESAGTGTVSIVREGGSDGIVSIVVETTNGGTAQSAQDYTPIATVVTFADREGGAKNVSVAIINDVSDEPDETIALALRTPTGGASVGARSNAALTILDDDLPTHRVGGEVRDLAGSGLVLQNNSGDDLAIASDGSFSFATPLPEGTAYSVTVKTQPTNPAQTCAIENANGTVPNNNVINIVAQCRDLQRVLIRRRAGGTQNDISLVYEDGSNPVTIANTTDDEIAHAVTTDGRIIYTRIVGGQADIYSVKLDGTGLVALANSPESESTVGSSFGAGTTASGKVVFSKAGFSGGLFVVNPDGSGLLNIAPGEYCGVAPNGRVIYSEFSAATKTDLYSVSEDGTDRVTLAATADYEECQDVTPSGKVIFTRIVGSQRDLYSVNADGTGLAPLSVSPLTDEFKQVIPVSERVLFKRDPTAGQSDLYSVNADGTDQVTLAASTDTEYLNGVTADGRVIFARLAGATNGDVYIINADGTGLFPLAATADQEFFSGFTNTGRIIFVRVTNGQHDIYTVSADGSDEVRLTDTPEDEFAPCGSFGCLAAASGANDRIVFEREPAGGGLQSDLFSIRPDGTDEIALSATADAETFIGVTASGRVLFYDFPAGQADVRSVIVDGSGLVKLSDTPDIEVVDWVF